MVTKSPGSGVPADLDGRARSAWYAWKHYHAATATDPMSAGMAMYARGWRDCFFASVEVAGLRPVLERWVTLLEELRVEQEFSDFVVDKLDGEKEG